MKMKNTVPSLIRRIDRIHFLYALYIYVYVYLYVNISSISACFETLR